MEFYSTSGDFEVGAEESRRCMIPEYAEQMRPVSTRGRSDCSSPLIEICQPESDVEDTEVEEFVINFLDDINQPETNDMSGRTGSGASERLVSERFLSGSDDEIQEENAFSRSDVEVEGFVSDVLDVVVQTAEDDWPDVYDSPKERRPKKESSFSKLMTLFGGKRIPSGCSEISLPVPGSVIIQGPTGELREALLEKEIDDLLFKLRADLDARKRTLLEYDSPFRLQISASLDSPDIAGISVKLYQVTSLPGNSRLTRRVEETDRLPGGKGQLADQLSAPVRREEKFSQHLGYSQVAYGQEYYAKANQIKFGNNMEESGTTEETDSEQEEFHDATSTKRRSKLTGFLGLFGRRSKKVE